VEDRFLRKEEAVGSNPTGSTMILAKAKRRKGDGAHTVVSLMANWLLHSWTYWLFLVILDMCALGTLLGGIGEIFNAVVNNDPESLYGIVLVVTGAAVMWNNTPSKYKKRKGG
jgi:hypothetical protein